MIVFLRGEPKIVEESLILMTGGVGYGVNIHDSQLRSIKSLIFSNENDGKSTEIELHIYTHVREEVLDLYGFETVKEKKLFLLLLSVSGVGPRTALTIVGQGSGELSKAVQEAQVHFFTSIPRVGKKMAEKIIIELRGKLGEIKSLNLSGKPTVYQDVIDSLVSLGFGESEVSTALDQIDLEKIGEQAAIKQIIKQLGKKS